MIFIDGVETKIDVKEFEAELEKEGLRFPLRFKLAEEPPFKWWDDLNKKTRYVPVWGIPSAYTMFDKSGKATHIRYTQTHIKENNKDTFTPSNIEFENGHPIVCNKKDVDLAKTLYYHTWRRESGEVNHSEDAKACFYVENKKKDAMKINEESQTLARAYEILYKELQNEPERKKDIAKAMGHIGVDFLSDLEVTAKLAEEIKRNPTNFIYYTEGAHTVVKARVRHAIDNGLVTFELSTRTWYWLIQSTGIKGEQIMQTSPTQNSTEALCDFFLSNTAAFRLLATAVEAEKQSPKEVVYAEKPQVSILSQGNTERAELEKKARSLGIKGALNKNNEKLKQKIKEAELQTA